MSDLPSEAFALKRICAWVIDHGYATGPGDSIDDVLAELVGHVRDTERARCVKIINLAREGEIDTDLRTIRAHIEHP